MWVIAMGCPAIVTSSTRKLRWARLTSPRLAGVVGARVCPAGRVGAVVAPVVGLPAREGAGVVAGGVAGPGVAEGLLPNQSQAVQPSKHSNRTPQLRERSSIAFLSQRRI